VTARKSAARRFSKLATGIKGFDQLSRGGLPRNRTSLVMGGPGTGKTVFALQTLINAARERKQPGIFSRKRRELQLAEADIAARIAALQVDRDRQRTELALYARDDEARQASADESESELRRMRGVNSPAAASPVPRRGRIPRMSANSRANGSRRTKFGRIAAVARATTANRLLAALPAKEYEGLLDGLEAIRLTYGEVLDEPGEQMRYVYFPCDCLVSLLTVADGRRALEVGLVGREGMVGSRLALGFTTSSVRALVQGTGTALRIESVHFRRKLQRSPTLQRALLRFTDALMLQVTQNAACNRFHVVEARLARRLLMTRERVSSHEFHLTHEFLAAVLGVRRAGVTMAASALQRQQLIRYRRGAVTILDQQGLEASACSCYQQVRLTRRAPGI